MALTYIQICLFLIFAMLWQALRVAKGVLSDCFAGALGKLDISRLIFQCLPTYQGNRPPLLLLIYTFPYQGGFHEYDGEVDGE